MGALSILVLALAALLIGWMGVACWREEQERVKINVMIARIEKDPAYIETVNERLRRESRR